MYCSNCGVKNDDKARFCENCGNSLVDPKKAVAVQQAKPVKTENANEQKAPEPDDLQKEQQSADEPQAQPQEQPQPEAQPQPAPQPRPQPQPVPQPRPQSQPNYAQQTYASQTNQSAAPQGGYNGPVPTGYNQMPAQNYKDREKPMSTWAYIGMFLLLCIPILNIILIFKWAFGRKANINKRNYIRAILILALVSAVVWFFAGPIIIGFVATFLQSIDQLF